MKLCEFTSLSVEPATCLCARVCVCVSAYACVLLTSLHLHKEGVTSKVRYKTEMCIRNDAHHVLKVMFQSVPS